ncbi:pentapeptide repeat-containing protein [Streptomyces bauhiniae]|uniref:pentapeptide repeat-containing protein n=1 Tax=Streptomyces bauhiniae TaxID=2340725 RepID=UPI0034547459
MTEEWPSCQQLRAFEGHAGPCGGRVVEPHAVCLAHLRDETRDSYLTSLGPGSDVDHRGTIFDEDLFAALTHALQDADGTTTFGNSQFGSTIFSGPNDRYDFRGIHFSGYANFRNVEFEGVAEFDRVTFTSGVTFKSSTFAANAPFDRSTFEEGADFASVTFEGWADFTGARFSSLADFPDSEFAEAAHFFGTRFHGYTEFSRANFRGSIADFSMGFNVGTTNFSGASFHGPASFTSRTFHGKADFTQASFALPVDFVANYEDETTFKSAQFTADVNLSGAKFDKTVNFQGVKFEAAGEVGPMSCASLIDLSGAAFSSPVTIALSAARVDCRRTRWMSTAVLQLRHAALDFSHAVYEFPLTISAEHGPFVLADGSVLAEHAAEEGSDVRLRSLRGVDAAHLLLSDINMSECLLAGTVHLDQIRFEGDCRFGSPPNRTCWNKARPVRFTRRRIVAEEQHWRARQGGSAWGSISSNTALHTGPAQLAPVYRSLRKSYEDNKNEPGSADFYYGEMEMRRNDPNTEPAERSLLAAYWALSGYGLRATRALVWLLSAAAATLLTLMLWGIPEDDPKPVSSGHVRGADVRLVTETPDPVNPHGPLNDRLSSDRFEKGLRVVINSVIFRSSDQDLTTAGTYIEMASRLSEPILLGLAALAIRGRVKR